MVLSVAQHRSSLALGNIVGSTISNILGAFSLGLLFHKNSDEVVFDKSSKIYSLLLLVLTAVISALVAFGHRIVSRAVGAVAIGLFVVYILSIAWTIYKGLITAPEASDSDSSDDDSDSSDVRRGMPRDDVDRTGRRPANNGLAEGEQHCNANASGYTV